MANAINARVGMLFVGLVYFILVFVIRLILSGIFANVAAVSGAASDAWQFFLLLCGTLISLPIVVMLKHFTFNAPNITAHVALSRQFSIFALPKGKRIVQFQDAILMFLVVFAPLDLISYLIPGMLQYEATSIYVPLNQEGLYLALPTFGIFFAFSLLTHFFVAANEEIRFRGVLQFLNQDQVGATSAILISALFFGLSHFSYWFSDFSQPVYFPIWWGTSAFLIGLMLSFYLKACEWILPMILAHWWNNVMSTVTIWMFLTTHNSLATISTVAVEMYLPLIVAGIILAILWRTKIGAAFNFVKKEFHQYAQQPRYQILLDVLFGIAIWGILLIIPG